MMPKYHRLGMTSVLFIFTLFIMPQSDAVAPPQQPTILASNEMGVKKVAFSSNSQLLAGTFHSEQQICVWSVAAPNKILYRLPIVRGKVVDLSFHPTRPVLAIACGDQGFALWNYLDGKVQYFKMPGNVSYLSHSPNGKYFATTFRNCVAIWNAETLESIALITSEGEVQGIQYSPDSTTLAVCSHKDIQLWDYRGKDHYATIEMSSPSLLQFVPKQSQFVVESESNILIYDYQVGKVVFKTNLRESIFAIGVLPAENAILITTIDSHLYYLPFNKRVLVKKSVKSPISSIAVSPSGKYLAFGFGDPAGRNSLHSNSKGEFIPRFPGRIELRSVPGMK